MGDPRVPVCRSSVVLRGYRKLWELLSKKGSTPARIEQDPSDAPSEPSSDSDDRACQANSLYMDLPHKRTLLRQAACPDSKTELALLVREDREASRLPQSDLDLGIPLCRNHRGIYQAIRSNQVCTALQCVRLGVTGPEGRHYCNDHVAAAVLPVPTGPKVKFEIDPNRPKSPAMGVDNIPDDVLSALINSMSYKEGLTDPEIADKLTSAYGGLLLHNALRIKDVWGAQTKCDPSSSSTAWFMVKEETTPAPLLWGRSFRRLHLTPSSRARPRRLLCIFLTQCALLPGPIPPCHLLLAMFILLLS